MASQNSSFGKMSVDVIPLAGARGGAGLGAIILCLPTNHGLTRSGWNTLAILALPCVTFRTTEVLSAGVTAHLVLTIAVHSVRLLPMNVIAGHIVYSNDDGRKTKISNTT